MAGPTDARRGTPDAHIDRYVETFLDAYPDAEQVPVDEAILARGGPIDGLVWMAFDGYSDHTWFHQDPSPDPAEFARLVSVDPDESDMAVLRTYLQERYDSYTELEDAALLRLPDPYQPGRTPAAHVAPFYDSFAEELRIGLNAEPVSREKEIINDIDRLVPASDLETFTWDVVREMEADAAARRVATGNILDTLEADDAFRKETTKPMPESLHPEYGGTEAELWQKPAANIDYMEGSQGFLQLWVPVTDPQTAVIDVTAGEYDEHTVIDRARDQFE